MLLEARCSLRFTKLEKRSPAMAKVAIRIPTSHPRPINAAQMDAATGLLDIRRLGEMLSRIKGRIVHKALDHVSPLSVPVMLEIGRETVYGEASEAVMAEAAEDLIREAMA